MSQPDRPPPMPQARGHTGDEVTMLQHGALPASDDVGSDDLPDLPDNLRDLLPMVPHATGARVTLSAMTDDMPGYEAVRAAGDQLRRQPVSTNRRPTLLPSGFEAPPKLPGAVRTADPALVRPVRPSDDAEHVSVGIDRESSDVISEFSSGFGASPSPMQGRNPTVPPPRHPTLSPRDAVPPQNPGGLVRNSPQNFGQTSTPPPPQPQAGRLVRRPPQPSQSAVPQMPAAPPPQPPYRQPPSLLPLPTDRVVGLIAEHRARLVTLDMFARVLEVGAGLLVTLSLTVLVTTLVKALIGDTGGALWASVAFLCSGLGLAGTVGLVAGAATLRHLAHTSAQISALLEALSTPQR